jgi:hypothetical protein
MRGLPLGAAAAFRLSACSSPNTDAFGNTELPLKAVPNLAGAATPGGMIRRSPERAGHERAASSHPAPAFTV